MSKTDFVDYIIELLQICNPPYANISYKRMFGCYGLFYPHGDKALMFALVDDSNRNDYLSLDLPIFVYEKQAKAVEQSYFLAPEDVLDSEDNMETWARKAIDVALRKAKK